MAVINSYTLQPSKSQVKSEDLTILYSDVDDVRTHMHLVLPASAPVSSMFSPHWGLSLLSSAKERKGTLRRGTLSKRSAAVMAKDIADNSLSPPTLSGQSSPRSANNSPRGTATPSLSGAPSRGPPTIRVRARWAFNAEREGELSMAAGDVLSITDKTSQNWWMAELNGKRGVIPANYIEVLAEQVGSCLSLSHPPFIPIEGSHSSSPFGAFPSDEPPPLPPPSSSLETKADSSIKLASSSSDPRCTLSFQHQRSSQSQLGPSSPRPCTSIKVAVGGSPVPSPNAASYASPTAAPDTGAAAILSTTAHVFPIIHPAHL